MSPRPRTGSRWRRPMSGGLMRVALTRETNSLGSGRKRRREKAMGIKLQEMKMTSLAESAVSDDERVVKGTSVSVDLPLTHMSPVSPLPPQSADQPGSSHAK